MCFRSMPSPGPCNPARRPRWPRGWTASAGAGSTTTGPDCRSRARWRNGWRSRRWMRRRHSHRRMGCPCRRRRMGWPRRGRGGGVVGGWAEPAGGGVPVPPRVDGLPAQRSVDAPPSIDVLLLGNHGLVVGGASVLHAEQRLAEVASRLRRPVRAAPAADGAGLALDAAATGWRLPGNARGHAVATDPVNLERAVRGVLYPDHVVFLGHQMSVAPAALARGGPALSDWLRAQTPSAGPAPPDPPPPPPLPLP